MTLFIWRFSSRGRAGWRVAGRPIGAAIAVLALVCLGAFFWAVGKYVRDSYFPYRGEVVGIRSSLTDWFVLESADQEHLVIRTPEGEIIDRVISTQSRNIQRIEVGDYVVKERGFRSLPDPRGKMSVPELRQKSEEALETTDGKNMSGH